MNISFAICTHNETDSLRKLINRLLELKRENDEIVILDDFSENKETLEIIQNHNHRQHKLNGNYGVHKNKLNDMCEKDFIFQFDADELPTEPLIKNVHDIIVKKQNKDLIKVPRVNYVHGITELHLKKWNWKRDHLNRINYPDFQTRLFKNDKRIRWTRAVHEIITGHHYMDFIEPNTFHEIIHIKDIKTQEESNSKYHRNYNQNYEKL